MNLSYIVTKLRQQEVVAYPTEAVFGLGCDPHSERAVKKLLVLKNRPIEKGLILVASDVNLLRPFIDCTQLKSLHWQRLQQQYAYPITWIVPAHPKTPSYLTGHFNSIAVRLCMHPAVAQLCEQTGFALTSTSANLSGQMPCKTADEVKQQFGIDFPVLEKTVGSAKNPSEIRDIFTQHIFRQG